MAFHSHCSLPFSSALRAGLLGAVSVLAIDAARAQEATSGVTLDTVTVVGEQERGDGPVQGYVARQSLAGTKTDTPIAETPQSISVVPRQQMEDQEVESVAEALRYTPGVFSEYRGASNVRDEVIVRGFAYVPRYLDGMLVGGDVDYAKIYPYLLERVELLSGPSSVLYGQVNPGGIINMVSKKPTFDAKREVEFTIGNNMMFQGSFDFADRIVGSDTMAFRIVGTGLSTNLQEDFAKQQGIAIAPSFTWRPNEATTFTVLSGFEYEPDFGFRNFLDAAGTVWPIKGYGFVPRDFFVSDPNYETAERTQAWIGYEFEHKASDALTLRQKMRYFWVDYDQYTLVWGWTSANPKTGANTIVHRTASGGGDTWGTFTNDNQAEFKFGTGPAEHTVLAGLDYRYRSREYNWGYNWSDVPTISLTNPIYGYNFSGIVLNPNSDQEMSASQIGAYLQDQVKIGDLHLIGGIRQDWADTSITEYVGPSALGYDDSAFTYRVGALYTFANGIAPYASYSTSFEPAIYAPPLGEAPFKPTTAEQFEVGVKYAPEGTRMLFTAAYYDIWQQNVMQNIYDPGIGTYIWAQIGEMHNRGFELSAHAEVNRNLSVIASYSYIDSTITETGVASELGKTPSRIPQNTASLWAKYAFDEGNLRGLEVGGGVRYIGTSWGNNANTFEVPAYTLFDAMLKYDLGAFDRRLQGAALQLNAKNIGDLTYVASCANAYACFYGEGRTVTASLKYNW
ncbi:TonB-dependent siderophore receptor [Xanthobacter dioxanivorans]|uniref:TonB-dependent siderophore receptor n=1 Tax=Xanthobacter dioxanivorans TaxID=2528964 RepID=A0A974SHV0_9HYPH|nr:TonB-dependent siderophore receptor [Xanthobacter dioxanivorans]QRG05737.1 TonB-dependent siderophore receptor [Xanthobacter dioxanivorans]